MRTVLLLFNWSSWQNYSQQEKKQKKSNSNHINLPRGQWKPLTLRLNILFFNVNRRHHLWSSYFFFRLPWRSMAMFNFIFDFLYPFAAGNEMRDRSNKIARKTILKTLTDARFSSSLYMCVFFFLLSLYFYCWLNKRLFLFKQKVKWKQGSNTTTSIMY